MIQAAIQANGLTVKKGKQTILSNLAFTVGKGNITGLIGPSGSGKTTLMRTIVGVQKYQGSLHVYDKPAGHASLRRMIGYVTQSPAVYSDLTVEQNLQYFGALVGTQAKKTHEIMQQVSLEKQAKQIVASLSGGQKARVSIAVALLGNPEVLILDEPTVGLDPLLRNELWELFAELAREGKTLIISSHVMDEAERCSNLLLMRDGTVLWQDTREKLLRTTTKNSVEEAFIAMIRTGEAS